MIFLTVGTHEPFDRLVRSVDQWCAERDCGDQVFGQITGRAGYRPTAFEAVAALDPSEYRRRFEAADFIVSHAGMGSIITALTMRKPIVVMPRRGHLRETRNDHQFATARRFRSRAGIYTAEDETDLPALLQRLTEGGRETAEQTITPFADERLVGTLREFIQGSVGKG